MKLEKMEIIGRICREARIDHGHTLDDVAKHMHYTKMTLSRFERGHDNNALLLVWYIMYFSIDLVKELSKYDSR